MPENKKLKLSWPGKDQLHLGVVSPKMSENSAAVVSQTETSDTDRVKGKIELGSVCTFVQSMPWLNVMCVSLLL